MAVSESLVRQLRAKIDVPPKELRAALTATTGDVDKALLHLIDSGRFWYSCLRAAAVPEEALFVRAHKAYLKAQLAKYIDMLKRFPNDEFVTLSSRACRDEIREQLKDPETFKELRDEVLSSQQSSADRRAREKAAGTVKIPPLPPLKSDGMDEWTGRDTLKSWAGYRAGARGKASSGKVQVILTRGEDKDGTPRPPAQEQVAAYAFLKDRTTQVADATLTGVLKYVRQLVRDGYFADADEPPPAIRTAADLKCHIDLAGVRILDYAKSGHAYVGLHFGCTWDEEHDLGVLLHKSRVIEVEQADASFDHHAAKRDGGKKIR